MQTGFMTMYHEFRDGSAVELSGTNAKYWEGMGLPTYEGDIEGLPADVLEKLVKAKLVKKTS